MSLIKFSTQEKELIVEKIQQYFDTELKQDIGQFDAEFLLDFFTQEIGHYFYNRGINDAQIILKNKLDDISDTLYELEKPTDFVK